MIQSQDAVLLLPWPGSIPGQDAKPATEELTPSVDKMGGLRQEGHPAFKLKKQKKKPVPNQTCDQMIRCSDPEQLKEFNINNMKYN